MSALPTLPNLPSLPTLDVTQGLQAASGMVLGGSAVSSVVDAANAGTKAVSNFLTKNITIGIGVVMVIIGLIVLTKTHHYIIAAGKEAAKSAATAAIAA